MKLSTNRYHVVVTKDGKSSYTNYYGYTTRKNAEELAERWREIGFEAKVVDNKKK